MKTIKNLKVELAGQVGETYTDKVLITSIKNINRDKNR